MENIAPDAALALAVALDIPRYGQVRQLKHIWHMDDYDPVPERLRGRLGRKRGNVADQPMPLVNNRPPTVEQAKAILDHQAEKGVRRYGTPLQAFNGRDALVDAYQEVLDLACYLRQAIEERTLILAGAVEKLAEAANG